MFVLMNSQSHFLVMGIMNLAHTLCETTSSQTGNCLFRFICHKYCRNLNTLFTNASVDDVGQLTYATFQPKRGHLIHSFSWGGQYYHKVQVWADHVHWNAIIQLSSRCIACEIEDDPGWNSSISNYDLEYWIGLLELNQHLEYLLVSELLKYGDPV